MGRVIVGTAGHIDHGKSSLVRALTGTDPDRLPEEKRRQITIDLGYVFLDDVAAIIDVPGHEKFIHNMVAGASTIDFALLVVASDDGIMPQTREHLHILRLLGLKHGAIVLTKCGMTDPEWQALVKDQIKTVVRGTFLSEAPIFDVDSLSRMGIQELRSFLLATLPTLPVRRESDVMRIPIDRVFSVRGHGTVVTGTILSGSVERDQKVELLPGSFPARVKQLQSNARDESIIRSGMRAALNLNSAELPVRGQTITQPSALTSSRRLAVRFEQIPDAPHVKDRQRVRFLTGTQEVMGRFRLLGEDGDFRYAILLLDEEVVCAWHDHFILRRYSPMDTMGGGIVLDIDPPLRGSRYRETALTRLSPLAELPLAKALPHWLTIRAPFSAPLRIVCQTFAISENSFKTQFVTKDSECKIQSGFIFHADSVLNWRNLALSRLKALHTEQTESHGFSALQISPALPLLPPQVLDWLLADLTSRKEIGLDVNLFKLAGVTQSLDARVASLIDLIIARLKQDGFAPSSATVLSESLAKPKSDIERALVSAYRADRAVRIGTDIFFERAIFDNAIARVRQILNQRGSLQVADLSKDLNSSRKFVVPFLEFLDTKGITERRGNDRVPGRNFDKKD